MWGGGCGSARGNCRGKPGSRDAGELLASLQGQPPRTKPVSTAPAGLLAPASPAKRQGQSTLGTGPARVHPDPPSGLDPETWALSGMAPKRMDFKDVWYLDTRTMQHSDQRRASSQNLSMRVHGSNAPAARR